MPRRLFHPLRPLVLSLILAIAIAVPVALIVQPKIDRHIQLSRLSSPDPEKIERGLKYVVQHADDETLPAAMASYLWEADPDTLLSAYAAVAGAGQGDDSTLVKIIFKRLATNNAKHTLDFESFVRISELLYQHGAGHPRLLHAVSGRLEESSDQEFTRLYSLLELINGWDRQHVSSESWVRWIALGHAQRDREWPSGAPPLIRAAPDLFDESAIVSVVRELATADLIEDRREALNTAAGFASSPNAYRALVQQLAADPDAALAAQARRVMDVLEGVTPPPIDADPALVGEMPDEDTDPNAVWRTILTVQRSDAAAAWWQTVADAYPHDHPLHPVALAALYRLASPDLPPVDPSADELNDEQWKRHLAALEGTAALNQRLPLVMNDNTPHLLRPVAVRVAESPDPAWLWHTLLLDKRTAVRDQACLAAAQRFTDAQLDALIVDLIKSGDPQGKMSAGLLAGLSGRQADLILKIRERERDPAVSLVLALGLWTQQKHHTGLDNVPLMLGRESLPDTTFLTAMLHRGQRAEVLDYLFSPAYSQQQLLDLLGERRWERVLYHYLPDDAPRIPLWADEAWTLDVLRRLEAWHWVHRHDATSSL